MRVTPHAFVIALAASLPQQLPAAAPDRPAASDAASGEGARQTRSQALPEPRRGASVDRNLMREVEDDSWVRVSGTVVQATDDSFLLDYGQGLIRVEVDDWAWEDAEGGAERLADDRVTVEGRIDDGFYEAQTLEAARIHAHDLNTVFDASAADEESASVVTGTIYSEPEDARATVTGRARSVDGRRFVLATGDGEVVVDTTEMTYDPLDARGHQQVRAGDRVAVTGVLDDAFFAQRYLIASDVTTIRSGRRAGAGDNGTASPDQ